MRFKAGLLGLCIVVLSLFGTVLSGFLLGVESDTRETTSYNYITDVTGLFDITNAPEYVDYSPSSNYVGYSPALAVDYSPSSTVNSYRYVKAPGTTYTTTATITNSSSYPSDTGRFSPSEAGTSGFIDWDGSINFGSTVTFQDIVYNASTASVSVQVGEYMGSMPMITSLARIIQGLNLGNYNTLSIDITYGSKPVMFYYGDWTFTSVSRGDGLSQYIYSVTLDESNSMPTHLEVNMATYAVTASRNGTQLWNVNAGQVDVIYNYSDRSSGSFAPVTDASATFAITAKTYPTYGYMDPTKGVSMDIYGPTATYQIKGTDNYPAMSGLFNTPVIPYPDSSSTQTVLFTNVSASGSGVLDTSFFTGYETSNNSLTIYPIGGPLYNSSRVINPDSSLNRYVPDVGNLGGWINHWGIDTTALSSLEIEIGAVSGYSPVFFCPGLPSVSSVTTNYVIWSYGTVQRPDTLIVDCLHDVVTAYSNDTLLWTSSMGQVCVVNSYSYDGTDQNVRSNLTITSYGMPGANTGPSYPILYINNESGYGGAWNDHLTISGQNVNTAVWMDTGTNTLQITSLSAIMSTWGLSGYDMYNVVLNHGTYPLYIAPKTPTVWSYLTVGDYTQPWAKYAYTAGPSGNDDTIIDRFLYSVTDDEVTAYIGDTELWTANPSDVWVAYKYALLDGSESIPANYQTTPASVNTTAQITPIMSNMATWQNGYQNDTITMTVQRFDLSGNNITIRAGSSWVTVLINTSGNIGVTGVGGSSFVLDIGMWRGVQLTINASEGWLAVTPSNNLSYTSPIALDGTTRYVYDWYSGGDITQLSFSTTGQTPYWQITNTTVFLDTYNAVMYDPSLKISDYFPDLDYWRLNFYSFATYGDSFTINNVLFTVDRTSGTVTWSLPIGDDTETYTQPLNNIYVTNQDVGDETHIMLSFANNKAVYDLGQDLGNPITFSGLWFFTTGLYEAVTVVEEYYNWLLDSAFHIDEKQALVIFLGLLVLGSLIAKGLGHISFKSLDGIVVIGAGLIVVLILGGA